MKKFKWRDGTEFEFDPTKMDFTATVHISLDPTNRNSYAYFGVSPEDAEAIQVMGRSRWDTTSRAAAAKVDRKKIRVAKLQYGKYGFPAGCYFPFLIQDDGPKLQTETLVSELIT